MSGGGSADMDMDMDMDMSSGGGVFIGGVRSGPARRCLAGAGDRA